MKLKKMKKQFCAGLVLSNVSVCVGEKEIVHDITLAVNPGEIHVLMGPNGSGKSSLLYGIMGHPRYLVTKGKITLFKTSLTKVPVEKRAQKGLFLGFQQPREIPGLRSAHFLRSLNTLHSPQKKQQDPSIFMKEAREYMKIVNLHQDFLGRSLNEGFSGGEKKKMELVQLMAARPRIALLDEIDSGVDIDALKSIISTIVLLKKKHGIGALLVTHNPRVLSLLQPDAVHIMQEGTIIVSGDKRLAKKIEKEGFKKISSK